MIKTITSLFKKFNPNLYWSFASKGVAAGAFILIDIILARSLEIELYGEWQQFYSLLTILLFIIYAGVPAASQAFSAQNSDKPELKAVLRNSLLLQILVSGTATGLVLILNHWIAGLVQQPQFEHLLLLAAPFLLLSSLEEYFKNIFIGAKHTQYHFYINLVSFGFKLVFLVILFINFQDIPIIIYAYTAATLLGLMIGFFHFKKIYKSILSDKLIQRNFFKEIFRYSLPLTVINFIYIGLNEINVQMLALLSSNTEVAYFGVAKQITGKLPQIALAVAMGLMPKYAQLTKENIAHKKKDFYRLLLVNFLFFLSTTVVIILLAPIAVPLIYGQNYANAVLPLQIYSIRVITSTTNIYLATLLNYQGLAQRRLIYLILSLLLMIGFNYFLTPSFGALGAAAAQILAALPYSLLLLLQLRPIFRSPKEHS